VKPLSKLKGKKIQAGDEDVEGYNASNSDNNFDPILFNNSKKNRSGVSNRKGSDVTAPIEVAGTRKMSNSCDHSQFQVIEEKG
jgi:hypothetical protein